MSKKKNSKALANRVILAAYRALGRQQVQYQTIDMIALELVALKGLKIEGKVNKMAVAEAISPGFLSAEKKARWAKEKRALAGVVAGLVSSGGPSPADIKAFYASWEWKRLSYDVKLERGRTCECCGAKAPNVTIHTDHVKPIRKHWHLRLDKTNLQVLCEDCNMGKGSRDETDFRAMNADQLTPEEEFRMSAIREQLRLN